MTLSAGARLGVYEIGSPLGAGGMGEVYRARDPRLGRDVAIKALPGSFKPRLWSDRPFRVRPGFRSFDLHPDGDRLVIAAASEGESGAKPDRLVFIFNFFDELRRIAPRSTH